MYRIDATEKSKCDQDEGPECQEKGQPKLAQLCQSWKDALLTHRTSNSHEISTQVEA